MKTITNIDQQMKMERLEIELEEVYERFRTDSGKSLGGRWLMSGMVVALIAVYGAVAVMM